VGFFWRLSITEVLGNERELSWLKGTKRGDKIHRLSVALSTTYSYFFHFIGMFKASSLEIVSSRSISNEDEEKRERYLLLFAQSVLDCDKLLNDGKRKLM